MLKMRLQRIGRKNDASFRLIVTDSRRGPKSGKHIDLLGSYNPKMNHVQFNNDKVKEWIAKGVQVSPTVHNLLVSTKVIEGKKVNVLPRKAPVVDEAKLKAEAEAAEAAKAEEAAAAETSAEASEETPADATEAAPTEETPAAEEAPAEEVKDEAPVEEPKEEAPAEETKEEAAPTEEAMEETPAEDDTKTE